jgi:hypothetical protein
LEHAPAIFRISGKTVRRKALADLADLAPFLKKQI